MARLGAHLTAAGFPLRPDALALFRRTQAQSWQLYSLPLVLRIVVPFALVGVAAFVGVVAFRRPRGGEVAGSLRARLAANVREAPLPVATGLAAVAGPALLALAGWDAWRWGFLVVTNLAVVAWYWIDGDELEVGQVVALALVGAFTVLVPFHYFEHLAPRPLTPWAAHELVSGVRRGELLRAPSVICGPGRTPDTPNCREWRAPTVSAG